MKISAKDQELQLHEQERQFKKLNAGYEKKVRARENEIKKVDELYDKKATMASLEGEDQYIQALDRNSQRIVGVSKEFEDKIQSYKDRLKETQARVESQEINLKTNEKDKLTGMKKNLENNFNEQYSTSVDSQRAIEESTNNTLADITLRSNSEKNAIESKGQFEVSALSDEYSKKTKDVEVINRARMQNELNKHKLEFTQQQDELKANMLKDSGRLKRLGSEKSRIQNDQLTFMDRHQQNTVKQKTDDFKIRYEKMVQEHNTIIQDLDTHLNADMKKMVEKSSSDKQLVASKIDDRFYQIEKLNPTVTETLDSVEVSLPIAEHEKENFHLSAQKRNIKMTLSRKFTETLTAIDGSIDKSTRSELFSKDVATKDLLNSNKISQKYENGVITYKIMKA